jgi:uncharacterized protein DUF6160
MKLRIAPLLLLAPSLAGAGLEPLNDASLSAINGQDGLTVTLDQGFSATQVNWVTDDNGLNDFSCSGGTANQHACTQLQGVALTGANGVGTGTSQFDLDVGADVSGNPMMALTGDWSAQRLVLQGLTFNTAAADASASSLGSFAVQSQGNFSLINRGGPFNSGGDFARLALHAEGDLFYRQGTAGSAEFSFADFLVDANFTDGAASGHNASTGRVGIDNNGIFLSAPFARTDIAFDLAFKGTPTDFDVAGRERMFRFGWHGGLVNPLLLVGAGGFGYGTYMDGANAFQDYNGSETGFRSEGINLLTEWDFDSDFRLDIGEAGGNGTVASLANWTRLGAAPGPMFSLPVIFDVIQGGSGPAGLCAGSFTSGVPGQSSCAASGGEWFASEGPSANEAAFGVLIRDARLLTYASRVQVTDPAAGGTVTPIDWGLAFTYGKLDADIFLYPQGRGDGVPVTTTNTGIRADITLLAQSPDAWRRANSSDAAVRSTAGDGWQTNTHFMVVDTASSIPGSGHTGVGFVNGDIMYQARDLFVRVTDGDSGYPDLPGGLWLQTDNRAQYRFRGIFGGGDMADLSYDALTKISLVDINLSTDRFIFVLNPSPVNIATGAAPIGFNGLLNFDGDAYMRFGEISSPQSTFFVDQVEGTIAWKNGELSLVSGQNTTDGLPQIAISNDLMLGQSAHFGDGGGQPLVGTVGFGSENFGRIAIPAGTWNSEVIVKIPN